jgi:cysteine desulfurase / selenocysteine lyase
MRPKVTTSSAELAAFRSQVPITGSRAYLFNGALAPAATPVRAAWDDWSAAWSTDPNAVYTPAGLVGSSEELRRTFAELICAEPACIAVTDNTSRAANIGIRILGQRDKRNVVVDEGTYPSSLYPWYASGDWEVRMVATDGVADAVDTLAKHIDADTVAVCISHVAPYTGRRHDLAALSAAAHAHGAALFVDAAQSVGVVPIDVVHDGVDILVTTAMKWLMGPPGVAFVYLAPSILADAPVLDVGYVGLVGPPEAWPRDRAPEIVSDARRYELGLPNLPGVVAAKAGIDLLQRVGIERIFVRVQELVTRCLDGLGELGADVVTPLESQQRAGVIVVRHPDPAQVFAACRAAQVDIGSIPSLRIDPHGFNDEHDIDRFLACFEGVNAPAARG